MTDDGLQGFHLTALDVRRYDFGSALRGYDRARVDQFREQVADELERLARLNQELDARLRTFDEQLKGFRERERALNDALVSAQQLRGEIRERAEREAQLIVREAQQEADRQLQGLRDDVRRAQDDLHQLFRTRRNYLAQVRHQLERQLSELNAVESEPVPEFTVSRPSLGTPAGPLLPEPSVAQEIRDLPPKPLAPTPSWLDAAVEEER
ncbi:MAG: DivIVA domain-containing protein [Gemmatimonas sp.]|jgi:DivIVA domain-containing protein|uniref:DivIVA domain-containing protein n=1 Tax=Gemmatimonas sp. TaxID=1962908 RepID=UPI00391EF057|nr:DivIVA domain-containing protein [Gemmatimonadota bacterium]